MTKKTKITTEEVTEELKEITAEELEQIKDNHGVAEHEEVKEETEGVE